MKLGPVTKLEKRKRSMSKKIDDNVFLANCDVIDVLLIFGQFGAFWKLDSKHMVCETYIFINSNLLPYKS